MASGMEQYVDLHVGNVEGAVVPIGCACSPDRPSLMAPGWRSPNGSYGMVFPFTTT